MSTINVIYLGALDEYSNEGYEVSLPRGEVVTLPQDIARKLTTVRRGAGPREFFAVDSLDAIPQAIRDQLDKAYRQYPMRVIRQWEKHAEAFRREADRFHHEDPKRVAAWRKGAMGEVKVAHDAIQDHRIMHAERNGLPIPEPEPWYGEDGEAFQADDDFPEVEAVKPKRGRKAEAVA